MSIRSGSLPKSNVKLHCDICGQKRLMILCFPVPREDGKMGVALLKVRNLLKVLRENKLPNSKTMAFPKKDLIAKCSVCNQVTLYDVNKNNKLAAQVI
jgi:hypothetical protein